MIRSLQPFRALRHAAFFVGLAAVVYVGTGYIGANPLALVITLLIGAFYLMGALELWRFDQATSTLARAVAGASQAPADLNAWLEPLHPSLRNAVRLRIDGERVGLPGPALAPYLTGLLVLLGMLGTFLGMVVTLNGTGLAMESATDLAAIRASLSAPVKGLGLAFGTSVAGVAASAMLGLCTALCRRERLQAAQALDTRIASTLRPFSQAHRRDASFLLLQRQAELMPELVDRLQAMMAAMAQHQQAAGERLLAGQAQFHRQAETAYTDLAASVGRSLNASLVESARSAAATLQPVVEATMAGIAREAAALHTSVAHTVASQLEGLSTRFETGTASVADSWNRALAGQQQTHEALTADLRGTLERFTETFAQRSTALVDGVAARLDTSAATLSTHWGDALERQQHVSDGLAAGTQQALAGAATAFTAQASALLRTIDTAQAEQQAQTAARDGQRLAAWTGALDAMSASLQHGWQQAGAQTAAQQQAICETLSRTAREMTAQTEAHARNTIAEVARLVAVASEAPRAAADVIAELREKLSDGMARDNAMLEERGRILATLETLLGAVNHASTDQRAAIDALVAASAEVLERVGSRFTDTVGAETGRMAAVAAQVSGSAVEVASLGEAFGLAVQLFSASNDKLGAQLQRIESALGKSTARSDEQLAYYVAQAREVVDLSILSQRQIVEDLQQLARQRAAAGSEA